MDGGKEALSPQQRNSISKFISKHRERTTELRELFTSLPESEKLIDDYSCALQAEIPRHGRLYVTQNWLCFYSKLLVLKLQLMIPFKNVRDIVKDKTARVIPNAIMFHTNGEEKPQYRFTSFFNRDVSLNIITKVWQNPLFSKPLSPLELVKVARKAWGEPTEVGTEEDLWGPSQQKDQPSESKEMKVEAVEGEYLMVGSSSSSDPSTANAGDTLSLFYEGAVVLLQSRSTRKNLRIANGEVEGLGGQGKYAQFRVHMRHPQTVALESIAIPGKYLAINQGRTIFDEGGRFCDLLLKEVGRWYPCHGFRAISKM